MTRRPITATPEFTFGSLSSIFRAVARTVVPEAAALDDVGWRDLETLVERSLQGRPVGLQRRFRTFLRLVQWLPVLRYGRPFTALDESRRTHSLRYLENHRIALIRLGFWGLRAMVFLGYYGRSAEAEAIGYRPEARGWDALP